MENHYTIEDIQNHLKNVRQEYKKLYGQYMVSADLNEAQNLYIDLLELRDYYNRIKLKLKENDLSFCYLN